MKIKYILGVAATVLALGIAMHRGLTQSPPVIVGPGYAPNMGTAPDPNGLSYYGGFYGGYDQPPRTYPVSMYDVHFGPEDIPQTSSSISTKMSSGNVTIEWKGEPKAIQSITIALLDKNGGVVSSKLITSLPTRATLKKTPKEVAYKVAVQYINGLNNTVTSPL
jgi:hypothetical protein